MAVFNRMATVCSERSPAFARSCFRAFAAGLVILSATVLSPPVVAETVVDTVMTGINPTGGMAIDPTASRLYIAGTAQTTNERILKVIDTTNDTVAATVMTGIDPDGGMAIDPTASRLYIAGFAETTNERILKVIDTTTITSTDVQPPQAQITTPANGSTYALAEKVPAAFTCTDDVALATTDPCVGTVSNGSSIDTSVIGEHPFSVTATDAAGLTATTTSSYTVSNTLADGLALWGSFTSIPAGYTVSAVDAGAEGVTITVTGSGTEEVEMSVCGEFTVRRIMPGSVVTLACGSVIADVTTGSIVVERSTTSGVVSMTVPEGGSATLKDNGDVVVAEDSLVAVSVTMGGVVQTVAPGASVLTRAEGFYQPVDMGGVWNTMRPGSTVPVKFEVFYGETEITDPAVVRSLTAAKVTCDSSGSEAAVEKTTTTKATGIRYDTATGHFIANWRAPNQKGCHRLTMTTDSGSTLSALFKLR